MPIDLPAHLDDGRVPNEPTTYRLVREVELPPELRGHDVAVVFQAPGAHMDLRVDGLEAASLHSEVLSAYRKRGPNVFRAPAEVTRDGTLHLELTVRHTWTQTAWFDLVPFVTEEADALAVASRSDWVNFACSIGAVVALLQVGITSIAIYLLDKRRRPYLYFGTQALCASVYPLHVSGLSQAFFGVYDSVILGTTLSATVTLAVYFVRSFFELSKPSRLWAVLFATVGVAFPLAFSGPFSFTPVAGRATVLFATASVAYQLVATAPLMVRHRDRWSAIALYATWILIAATTWTDLMRWIGLNDPTQGLRGGQFGLGSFALTLSALLTRRHASAHKESDALNAELGARVQLLVQRGREIDALNAELRRQVADRAAQISSALSLRESTACEAPRLACNQVINDRYRVVRALGSGGMGAVWEVEKVEDQKRFALKVSHATNGQTLARLAREAQIASSVTHPNVVGITDVDVSSAGFLFIVMELVVGETLATQTKSAANADWALTVLAQVADGVQALHAAGVVHRDLTPANVLLTGSALEPVAKITDFGISRLEEDIGVESERRGHAPRVPEEAERWTLSDAAGNESGEDTGQTMQLVVPGPDPSSEPSDASRLTLTGNGFLAGTPMYMAPELVASPGATVLPSSDLFSFGVLAFELLAGKPPFVDAVVLALLNGRSVRSPPSIATLRPDLPADAVAAMDACLAMSPVQRPTAREVAQTLQLARSRLAAAARSGVLRESS